MASALLLLAVVGGCLFLLWLSYKIEPHWVSKDGERMICFGQGFSRSGASSGRWRELRISRVGPDRVEVRPRRGSLAVEHPAGGAATLMAPLTGRRRVRKATHWKVAGQTDSTIKNRVMYMLDGNTDPGMPEMIAIRLPIKSRAIPMLEEIALRRSANASKPNPGTPRWADRPDPG